MVSFYMILAEIFPSVANEKIELALESTGNCTGPDIFLS